MHERFRLVLSLAILLLLGAVLAACAGSRAQVPTPVPQSVATPGAQAETVAVAVVATPEPLIPTLMPAQTLTATTAAISATMPMSVSESATPLSQLADKTPPATSTQVAAAPIAADSSTLKPGDLRNRLGVGIALNGTHWTFDEAMAKRLGMGWYLDWGVHAKPVRSDGLEFAQMIRVRGDSFSPSRAEIAAALAANPGSLWLIGNEPDVMWQDKTTPEDYARRYHELVVFIKTLDPSAQVAIGGVSQVTPLRLSYLERVLAAYEKQYGQPMPVDVWNIHTFILREERDSWGVSIPPGFDEVKQGTLWEIEDHDNLDLLRQQIVDFRRWMLGHGQRDKALIITEYGILMPEEYGFPPEQVADYMRRSFDLLLNTRDPELGYPADDNRLVQRLLWYSLSDTTYPTGNLVDPVTGELTLLGQTFVEYVNNLDASP